MNKPANFAAAVVSRKRLIPVILSAAALAAGIAFFATRTTATPAPPRPAAALTVTVTTATQTQWPATLDASGAIAPWQEAIIGAQVSGLRLAAVSVNVGDRVRRGQVLAVFDADLLRADEARLQAAWEQAEANRQRALRLKGSGAISEQDILQYVTQADIAKAQLRSTQLQLRYAQVTAPDDGIISARSATVGAVSSNGQELFRMIRQNRLEWRGELTASQLAQVKAGQRISLALPDGTAATASVRQTAPSVDGQTRLGIVYADLEPGSAARAGMYANGSVVLAQRPAVIVPAASVIIRDGRSYVPRLTGVDRVTLQAVAVGRRQGSSVEIVSGVATGDKVIVQGAAFLNDGDIVHVVTAAPAAQASGGQS
nr:efflux RND transporter periplasmic adaptor subunit [Burkholderia ambifaria]